LETLCCDQCPISDIADSSLVLILILIFYGDLCSGLVTPGGFASVPAGMETPELIELRKKKIEEGIDG